MTKHTTAKKSSSSSPRCITTMRHMMSPKRSPAVLPVGMHGDTVQEWIVEDIRMLRLTRVPVWLPCSIWTSAVYPASFPRAFSMLSVRFDTSKSTSSDTSSVPAAMTEGSTKRFRLTGMRVSPIAAAVAPKNVLTPRQKSSPLRMYRRSGVPAANAASRRFVPSMWRMTPVWRSLSGRCSCALVTWMMGSSGAHSATLAMICFTAR
mmetsp:Transcript_38848/g.120073  ORF Transcript_38848/g.120073 Transcript_38848/m.120073 type:complete len:206 (+) Transcript_38848:698-1315(+)